MKNPTNLSKTMAAVAKNSNAIQIELEVSSIENWKKQLQTDSEKVDSMYTEATKLTVAAQTLSKKIYSLTDATKMNITGIEADIKQLQVRAKENKDIPEAVAAIENVIKTYSVMLNTAKNVYAGIASFAMRIDVPSK